MVTRVACPVCLLARKFRTRLGRPVACSRNLQVAIARRPWAGKRKLKFAATAWKISGLALVLSLCPNLPAKSLANYRLGDEVEEDIVTPVPLVVTDVAATQALRNEEEQKVPVFFGYDSNVVNQVEAGFLSAFDGARQRFQDELERTFKRRTLDAPTVSAAQFSQFAASFQERDFPLTADLAAQWAKGESDETIRAEWRRLLRKMTGYYLLPDAVPPDLKLGTQVRILQRPTSVFPPNMETVHEAGRLIRVANLYTLNRARRQLPWTFEPDAQAAAVYLTGFLRPNCVLEAELTRQLRAKRTESVLVTDRYEPGRKIASRGQVIDAQIMATMEQLKKKLALIQAQQGLAEEQSKAAAAQRRNQWLLAGAPALLFGLGLVGWRLARRRESKALLPARIKTAATTARVITCPSCAEKIVIPPAASETAQAGVRAGLLTQLAHLLADKLVQKLISDRRGLLDAQQQAAQEMVELEARLEKIHAPLQDRLEAYEKRITELEKELVNRGEENRVLIEAKITLVRKQSEIERAGGRLQRN